MALFSSIPEENFAICVNIKCDLYLGTNDPIECGEE